MKPANDAQPHRDRKTRERPASEEPRTGVVRKVDIAPPRPPAPVGASSPPSPSTDSGEWRCLEWGTRPSQRPAQRPPGVSIAQLSTDGHVLRQTGPDEWLPDAGDFVHRMALLVAHGLGFARCRGVCLRSETAVISVSQAGATKVVGVSGPLRRMSNVLRRAGLE